MNSTGIALFVYDRPEHTMQSLDALKKNNINKLYIFADGPKRNSSLEKINQVKDIIKSMDWCETEIIENEKNKGLANSIVDGVNHVLQKHERIIVLEDDCVPSEDFVDFMNACFNKYEKNDQVMSVTGYAPPINVPVDYPYDIYFSYRSSSWGWGTWKRAWKHYNRNPEILQEIDSSRDLRTKVDRAGKDLYPMLKAQFKGKLDSWSIFWSLNIIKEDGLCINPVESRIINIGNDGTGVHCKSNNRYNVDMHERTNTNIIFPDSTQPNKYIAQAYQEFMNGPLLEKLVNFCKRKLSNVFNNCI